MDGNGVRQAAGLGGRWQNGGSGSASDAKSRARLEGRTFWLLTPQLLTPAVHTCIRLTSR